MIKPCLLLMAASLAVAASAQTAQSAPSAQFRHRAAITLSGAGPFHQLPLPMTVYQGVERADLGDLRVLNGSGEAVPHALLQSHAETVSQRQDIPLPLFPVLARPQRQGDDALSVEVRRQTDGTLIALRQTPKAAANKVVRGVVVDASKIEKALRSVSLTVEPTDTPFHAFSIETSDDLQDWRLLKGDAQLVRLEHAGQRIEQSTAQWTGDAGKYLRILWADPQTAPAITAVAGGVMEEALNQPPLIWSQPFLPAQAKDHVYDYRLPGHMPLQQLRITLPQLNTLAPVSLQRYAEGRRKSRQHGGWHTITQTVVYRLAAPQGEMTSPDIVLGWDSEQRLRLAFDARVGIGSAPPSLQIGFVPHRLVFLPRGDGPYTLAWGAPSTTDTALPIATLVPGYRSDRPLQASPAALQASAPAPAVAPTLEAAPLSKGMLWMVLLIGVAVLGTMVWRLAKQMKQQPDAKS